MPGRRARPPLDSQGLERLALDYAGRYATSRAKLAAYLARKLRERGWAGEGPPTIEAIVERFAELGYVDDRAVAEAKGRSLAARGYGRRRLDMALGQFGIGEADAANAREAADAAALETAMVYARRRRIGPFAAERPDEAGRRRAFAAMVRAGHRFEIVKTLLELDPADVPDRDA